MLIDTSIIFGARLVFLLASHRLLVTLDPTLAHLSTDGDDDTLVSRPATPDVEGGPMEERGDAVVVQNTKQGLSTASRHLFALCIAESCTLLFIVLAHEIGLFGAAAERFNFSACLHIVLGLVLVVLPWKQCLLFTYGQKTALSLSVRVVISFIPFAGYVFFFSRIPPYLAVDGEDTWSGWVVPSMGRLIFVGVIILAGLSGYGAARTAWGFWENIESPGEDAIQQVQRSLQRIRQDIADFQPQKRSWRQMLQGSELDGLRHMESDIARRLAYMQRQQTRSAYASTLWGKGHTVAGKGFAAYCALRVVMALPSIFIVKSRGNNGDWLSYLFARLVPVDDVQLWSRSISLAFTGLMILSSLARVLTGLRRALRLTRSIGSSFLLLILAQLFATYCVSLLVQMRASIPDDDDLLAALPDFYVFGRLFDVVFLVASLGTVIYNYLHGVEMR